MRFLRRNVVLMYAIYGVTLVSGLVVTPIMVSALGSEAYGVWAVITSLVVFLGLLDLGVAPTIVRFAAEQRGRGAPDETSALASAGLAVYGLVAAVTVVVGLVLAVALPYAVDVPDGLVGPARVALLVVVAAFAARFPLGLFTNLLIGYGRQDIVHVASLTSTVLYAVLVALLLLAWGGGIVTVAVLTLLATVVRLALPLVSLRRELPRLRLTPRLVTRERLRELGSFSARNFLIHVASKVVFSTDVIVVGIVLGAEAAAFYAVPAKLFQLAFGLGTGISGVLLFPFLSELEGAAERKRQEAYAVAGTRLGLALVLLAGLPLAVFPDRFLAAWLHGEYEGGFDASVPVLVLLVGSLVFAHPNHLLGQFLVARGRHGGLAAARIAAAVANVVLSVILAKAVGLWGVALATLVTEGLLATLVLPVLVARSSSLRVLALAQAWGRPLALAAVAGLPTLGVGRLLPLDSLPELGAVGLVWALAFTALGWWALLSPGERAGLRDSFLRVSPAAPVAGADEPA